MSGGHFDYVQYNIDRIADEVEQLILTNGKIEKDEYGGWSGHDFSKKNH